MKTCLVCHLTTVIRQPSSIDVPCCGVLHLVVLRSEQPTQCSSMTKRPCFLGPTEVHLELIQGVQASFSRSPMALCWLFCGESAQTPPCRLLVQSGVLEKHSPGKPQQLVPYGCTACLPVQHTCTCRTCYIGIPLISFSGLFNGYTSLIMHGGQTEGQRPHQPHHGGQTEGLRPHQI